MQPFYISQSYVCNMMSEREIIRGCVEGNRNAQAALYGAYNAVVRGICLRYTGNKNDAEDLVHDSLIKAIMAMKQYTGKGPFEAWLKRIAMNTCISFIKERNKTGRMMVVDENLGVADDDETTDENRGLLERCLDEGIGRDELLLAISQLPDGYRMVLNMYVIDELPHHEIARQLGISVSTSKSQLSRARNLLKKNLMALLPQYELNISAHGNEYE